MITIKMFFMRDSVSPAVVCAKDSHHADGLLKGLKFFDFEIVILKVIFKYRNPLQKCRENVVGECCVAF